jgi:hypothetical protein
MRELTTLNGMSHSSQANNGPQAVFLKLEPRATREEIAVVLGTVRSVGP